MRILRTDSWAKALELRRTWRMMYGVTPTLKAFREPGQQVRYVLEINVKEDK